MSEAKLLAANKMISICETNVREIAMLVSNESLLAATNLLKELLIELRKYREELKANERTDSTPS